MSTLPRRVTGLRVVVRVGAGYVHGLCLGRRLDGKCVEVLLDDNGGRLVTDGANVDLEARLRDIERDRRALDALRLEIAAVGR